MNARQVLAAAVCAGALAALAPVAASAHALALSSTPAAGSTLDTAPHQVTITFGEPPDPGLSSIAVVDTGGRSWTSGPSTAVPGQPAQLTVPLRSLIKAVYTVTWKTVSAVDGHLATGTFAFGVGVSPSGATTSAGYGAAPPSALAVIARLLLYAALVVATGAIALGLAVLGSPNLALRRLIGLAAGAALIGSAAVVSAQALAAGLDLGHVVSSSLGRALLERLIPAAVMVIAAGFLIALPGRWRVACAAVAAAVVACMVVDVLLGHAAAQSPAALNTIAQLLHLTAVGVWIGGLVALLVLLRTPQTDQRVRAVHRLSTLAAAGLLVVAATGVFRSIIEIQTWANLVSTAFGALVLLKIGLIAVVALLGALNRYGHIPRLPRLLRRLRAVVTGEALLGMGALAVAAALVNVAPPVSSATAAQASQQVVARGSDFATTVKVTLTVTPGTAGPDTFSLAVADYDSGRPVDARQVTLSFTLPGQSIIAGSSLTLRRVGSGLFRASSGNLAVDGAWKLIAVIEEQRTSVSVPLQLTTRSVAPVVIKTHFAGEPTLYTVALRQGGYVQVYIDPDRTGAVEFHMTFLDPKQQELQIESAAATQLTRAGPRNLAVRRLDSVGHFVADAMVRAGPVRFDMLATTPGGNVVSTYVDITPGS